MSAKLEEYAVEILLMAVCHEYSKTAIFCKCFRKSRDLIEKIIEFSDILEKESNQKIVTSISRKSDIFQIHLYNNSWISAIPWIIEDEPKMCGVRFNWIYIEDLPSLEDKIKYTVILPLITAKSPNSKIKNEIFNLEPF